jgi:hypothetical protein
MKAYRESRGIAPRIFDLGTRWRWVVSFTTRPLYPQGKRPWYPLDRRLGGSQSRSGCGGEENNSQLRPEIQPVAQRYTTELTRLVYIVLHKARAVIAQSVYRWATGWTIGVLGFNSRRGLGIFLFTTASRTALGPTQPPIQWVPGTLSRG